MKSWTDLEPDEYKLLSKHFTAGRQGSTIRHVVVHHNGGNLSIQGCYDVWQTREASAHYQVDAQGRIGQLVHDADTAWHAGSWAENIQSIGIEHADISTSPWRVSDATLDNGAHLVAAICRAYKLGRPQWGVNVFPHSHFKSTECPASLAGDQQAAYMARAQTYYDNLEETDMQLSDTVKRPDGKTGTVGDILGYMDVRLEQLQSRIYGGGISKIGDDGKISGTKTDLSTEAAWNAANFARVTAQVSALSAAVQALATANGLDSTAITQAITDAVDKALADVTLTLTAKEK